mmetsp:Transcript_58201/g.96491  ORF Transcript_58201/g.96491 Transcript_58201/m.96491 type:complete len:204 (-) Transcript_58201:226-837(-)|eukprot:CAMPEP_0202713562 /NCGR_PEP_ID=MMETSP1385-20130828/56215_1 /ASSEMBLY_ACC=CAM_ASM_000861 /TAXON_ID=933848 /ORGANISM="Elphidium margaritaceum" /LENGTH=203 /DNA_ID=CAMNT_0049373957 /DNA_START=25 /DNA_END=636 /DNA_ORIENTATION=+
MAHLDIGALDYVDQTIDTSILAIKAQQAADRNQQQLNQIVDGNAAVGGNGAGLAAPDGSGQPLDDDEAPADPFKDNRILYNSIDRGACYHAFAWMWCGCFEPKYKITASYAIGEEWEGCCVRVTDSMAYESVDDVRRSQGCCWCCLSYSPCCPCFNDMGDIVLLGGDASHGEGWKLKRIHRSKEIYDSLTRIVQATNKSSKPK